METETGEFTSKETYAAHIGDRVTVCVEAGGTASKCFTGYLIAVQTDYLRLLRTAPRNRAASPCRLPGGINLRNQYRFMKWERVMISIALNKIVSFTFYTPKTQSPEARASRRRRFDNCPPPLIILALILLLLRRR